MKELVLNGTKIVTIGLYKIGDKIAKVGDVAEIVDINNKSFCIIEYTNIEIKPFLDVSYEFAFKEGEGDDSIEKWRSNHIKFFNREYPNDFNQNSLVVCEEFRIVKIL